MKKILLMTLLVVFSATLIRAQQPQRPEKPRTASERAEQRLKRLDKELTLTDAQKTSLGKELLRIEQERDKLREAGKRDREQQQALREEEQALLKKTLTDEQYRKLEKLQQERRQQMKKGRGPGAAPMEKEPQ